MHVQTHKKPQHSSKSCLLQVCLGFLFVFNTALSVYLQFYYFSVLKNFVMKIMYKTQL